jgi:hypothetical protein
LKDGSYNLLAECNALRDLVTDLELELAEAKMSVAKDIVALEVKVVSVEAHVMDEDASMEKHFVDFKKEFTEDLAGLREAYENNIQSLGGLCLPILDDEPSIGDYVCWLFVEVAFLPEVFVGVNENFISVVIEGVLMMVGDSVDLAMLQASTTDSGVDIVFGGRDVWKTTHNITRGWWHSFGYKSTLATVQAKLREVGDRVCYL